MENFLTQKKKDDEDKTMTDKLFFMKKEIS